MIKTEKLTISGRQLIRTYSDAGYMIERDGVEYVEAIDPIDSGRVYTETETPRPWSEDGEYATEADYLAALAELGVTDDEEG